jgi:hypothetical protein
MSRSTQWTYNILCFSTKFLLYELFKLIKKKIKIHRKNFVQRSLSLSMLQRRLACQEASRLIIMKPETACPLPHAPWRGESGKGRGRDRGPGRASCAPSVTTAPQRIPSRLVGPRRVCAKPRVYSLTPPLSKGVSSTRALTPMLITSRPPLNYP